ncbi:hypothetical protein [Legionella sp. W05-934-2]|jgi:hypothetical protein|uniref:hypothetical protein n=1 Tax=Legionella sp. W05-934-2 TaxID=1198649 RepID=UPI0034633187
MSQQRQELPKKDKVTISLFSVENKQGTYNRGMFSAETVEDIKKIKDGLTEAARKAGREPPEVVLSVMLIPDWTREDNAYTDATYLGIKETFMEEVGETFGDIATVHDFYNQANLTQDEKQYLHGMGIPGVGGLGSCADMIKTHSIYDNRDRRHLNIDSNTKIVDFDAFYRDTFGAEDQQDLLNASYYDPNYVSVHNKIVYTHPQGALAQELGVELQGYCAAHKNDAADKLKNSVYAKAFTAATTRLGISDRVQVGADRFVHRANLEHPAFGLTQHVVTAINMSWAPAGAEGNLDHLKQIRPIEVGHTKIDFQAFQYIVKKNTSVMWHEEVGLTEHDKPARKALLDISNVPADDHYARSFYDHTCRVAPEKAVDLVNMIPNTPDGERFCRRAFNCSLLQLKLHAQSVHLDHLQERLQTIGHSLDNIGHRLQALDRDLIALDRRLDSLSQRLEAFDHHLSQLMTHTHGELADKTIGMKAQLAHLKEGDSPKAEISVHIK